MVLMDWLRRRWFQAFVHALALAPLAGILLDLVRGAFLADPVREVTTRTGRAALRLLLASLACTPLSTLVGIGHLRTARRPLGLYAFLYTALHFLTFAGLDYRFDLRFLVPAIFQQRFVLPGLAAGLILLALATTSTAAWQKRMGKSWKRLHRMAYVAGALAVLHVAWLLKDLNESLRYGAFLALLLFLRWRPPQDRLARLGQRLTRS